MDFENWEHNWYGYFGTGAGEPLPTFDECVDRNWAPKDLKKIVAYLKKCPVVLCAGMEELRCQICGKYVSDDCSIHISDNKWLWPSSLFHFVESHHVRLPLRFEEWIRENKYKIPKPEDIEIDNLQWP